MKTVGLALAAALLLGLSLLPRAGAVEPSATVHVAFLRGEQLALVNRYGVGPADALGGLVAGPTRAETAVGYRTYLPSGTRVHHLTVENGTAIADMNRRFVSSRSKDRLLAAVTQLVATLSTFRAVDRVQLLADGKPVRRVVAGISLSAPITLRHLQTPNIPVPTPPAYRLRPPDPATLTAQQQLIRLGYLLAGDADGRFGPTTSEGLLAFQKFEGLARTAVLDAQTRAALSTATPPIPITHGGPGKRAEILLDRQVALLIQDDRVVRTIAVSTGKSSTPTPPGSYRVYAKIPRWWSTPFREWLPWALPFVGGIAFHEFGFVPVYPASHGCVRQSFTVARWTYNFAEVGMPVRVLARLQDGQLRLQRVFVRHIGAVLSGWGEFAVVMGAATAALLGLLFVAVSIRVETIARSAELRNRSAQTLTLLLTGLLVTALLAVPDQPRWVLGVEQLGLALIVIWVALVLDRRAGDKGGTEIGRLLDAINPTFVTCSLLVIAAIMLILGHGDGIYLLVPALIAVLVGGVANAWLILVRLAD